jgi:hypothetical protein
LDHLCVPGTASYYDELKSLVRTHEQQEAQLVRARSEATDATTRSAAVAAAAVAEAEELRAERVRLKVDINAMQERRMREQRAAAKAEANLLAETKAATAAASLKAAERAADEVAVLRKATRADVQHATGELRAEHESARATWEAQAAAMRETAKLTSSKHALRLRQVISAEENAQAELSELRGRLGEMAAGCLTLGLRSRRYARLAAALSEDTRHLAWLRALAAREAACAEEARLELLEESARAADTAEQVVGRLRAEVRAVAKKQHAWREEMQARHSRELKARVREAAEDEGRRVREAACAEAVATAALHAAEVQALGAELSSVRAQLADFETLLSAQNSELMGEEACA